MGGLVVYLVILWRIVVFRGDEPLTMMLTAWLASPLPLLFLRFVLEDGTPAVSFDLSTQSWALLLGDVFFLPAAMATVAYGQQFVPAESMFRSWQWLVVCVAAGLAAGFAFHFLMEVKAYTDAGWAEALMAPTKLFHDFVSYPFLFGALLYLGIPVLAHQFWWIGAAGLAGVLLWGAAAFHDATKPPRPQDLHPLWDTENFSVIRR